MVRTPLISIITFNGDGTELGQTTINEEGRRRVKGENERITEEEREITDQKLNSLSQPNYVITAKPTN